ncbi:hypothetical protein Y1Q_0008029 [Alligator mississippiensis]|uniref:Uncharacterized protein n=1 Tax=Alligator mississippiensis TaxID=8496 RepID=A0A151NF87_ALLMI|nr:hypothetical protein Y1Q_0008029 [Alligator mississippiensis]
MVHYWILLLQSPDPEEKRSRIIFAHEIFSHKQYWVGSGQAGAADTADCLKDGAEQSSRRVAFEEPKFEAVAQ